MKYNKLHHWFLPSRKNKFHPVALRSTGLFVFLLIFVIIPPLYNVISVGRPQVLGYAIDINVAGLNSASNQERINNGLSPLTLNSELTSAATAKANDMFADNYWAHVAPDGSTPWTFILASGYDYISAGENLAKDFNTSGGVVSGWMASSSHRANVLNSSFEDVGYAVVNGVLLGSETTLVVAMYGVKEKPYIATTEPTTETPASNTPAVTTETPIQQTVNNQTVTETPTNNAAPTDTTATTETPKTQSQTKTIKNQVIAKTSNNKKSDSGVVAGAAMTLPLNAYNSFNWGQKVSVLLISTLILLFLMKHTMIWREKRRGLKHIVLRAHPLGQAILLMSVMIITLFSGVGVVL